MPTDRPTIPQLVDQGAAKFESQFQSRQMGVLARLRNSVVGIVNRVVAGGLDGLYKYADRLNRNAWPDTCDVESLPDHGARWGKPRLPASRATGTARLVGVDGSTIDLGKILQRGDGFQYVALEAGVIAAGVVDIDIEAVEPGQLGNAVAGTSLSLATPIPGVNSGASAYTEISGGSDIEDPEAWRARILARVRETPQAGAEYDFEQWALEVPGVTRAWCYPREQGAGTVVVRFVRDNDLSIIPDAGEVAAVQAYLEARDHVTSTVYAVAPIATPQNYTIQLLPDSPAIRAAVEAELRDLYRREAKPGGTMLISQEREAISVAAGENDHVLVSPSVNQAHTTGLLPTLGVITWA